MSSFFTVPASQRKRKRADDRTGKPAKRRDVERDHERHTRPEIRRSRVQEDERDDSISGSDSEDGADPETPDESEASSEDGETPAERRVRLAQRYLDNIREEIDEAGFDAQDLDNDLIAKRLKEDVDEAKGRQFRLIASRLDFANAAHCTFRADTLATTGVATCQPFVYTVSKDKTLIKWRIVPPKSQLQVNGSSAKEPAPGKRRPQQVAYVKGVRVQASKERQHGHVGPITCVAASPDGQFVVTGGQDKKLIVWRAQDLAALKTFTTHRDAVLGLSFAPSTSSQPGLGQQLFSASADRSIKTYSLAGEESLAYVETLFGHQDHVVAVSAMAVDQCISVGARDRSARVWNVVDETQLKFLGDSSSKETYQTGSLDSVAALPPKHFVTGSDSGAINLWSLHKKKALFTIQAAHGVDEPLPLDQVTSEANPKIIEHLKKVDTRRATPRPITALVALPGTDIVLSGSSDGLIRVWRLGEDKRSLVPFGTVGTSTAQVEEDGESMELDFNGKTSPLSTKEHESGGTGRIRGVVNSLAVFERRKELKTALGDKKEGETEGLCIVAGTGKESRLGRQMKLQKGRNGAVVFEVPLLPTK